MKYRLASILVVVSEIALATSNNDLFSSSGNNCLKTEELIFNGNLNSSISQSINDCLYGDTYSYNGHGVKNFFSNQAPEAPSLEKDGVVYELNYFNSVESLRQKIESINYVNQLSAYNNCNSLNTKLRNGFSVAQASYIKADLNYKAELRAYNKRNSEFQRKLAKAQKIKDKIDKYAYELCMNGLLVNAYGVPVSKIACVGYAKSYAITELIPEYNYRHNNELKIIYDSPELPPIAPSIPEEPIFRSCDIEQPIKLKNKVSY